VEIPKRLGPKVVRLRPSVKIRTAVFAKPATRDDDKQEFTPQGKRREGRRDGSGED